MIQKAFGAACRFYREQLNLSQEKFALQIGMDRTGFFSLAIVKGPPNDIYYIIEEPFEHYLQKKFHTLVFLYAARRWSLY